MAHKVLGKLIRQPSEGVAAFKQRVADACRDIIDPPGTYAVGRYSQIRPGVLDNRNSILWGPMHPELPSDECLIIAFAHPERGAEFHIPVSVIDAAPILPLAQDAPRDVAEEGVKPTGWPEIGLVEKTEFNLQESAARIAKSLQHSKKAGDFQFVRICQENKLTRKQEIELSDLAMEKYHQIVVDPKLGVRLAARTANMPAIEVLNQRSDIPFWGEFQPIVDAAMHGDPDVDAQLFTQAVRISDKTGVDIDVAAARIKTSLIEMLQLFSAPYPYSDQQLKAMLNNIAAAEPVAAVAAPGQS